MKLPFAIPSRESRAFDVIGLGLNSIDLLAVVAEYPARNSKHSLSRFAQLPGGEMGTATAVCARLGWSAAYIGSFGDDEFGRLSADALRAEGVSIDAARTVSGASNQFAIILVDERSGDRTILWQRDPRLSLGARDVPMDVVTSGRVLIVDSVMTEAATQAAAYARGAGIPTVLDIDKVRPGTHELLCEIDAIIGAETFPTELTGIAEPGRALAAIAHEFRAPVVCVTLGEQGSLTLAGGREIRTPAFRVECVDSTGAGDAFRGGFAAGCLTYPNGDIEDVLAYANAVAALNCRRLGARGALPTRQEVDALLIR